MRIDSNSGVNRMEGIRSKAIAGIEATSGAGVDSVELSSRAADLRAAMDALKGAPEVRENLVAELRSQIEQGTLDTSGTSLAEKLFGRKDETR